MEISFYEKEYPSLQAVRVNDTLGYNDNYESPVTVVPEVLAAYEQVNVCEREREPGDRWVKGPRLPHTNRSVV